MAVSGACLCRGLGVASHQPNHDSIGGFYWDNGKEKWKLGFRVEGSFFRA